jgi:hypothetical protein
MPRVRLGDAAGAAQVRGHAQLLGQDVDEVPHVGLVRSGQPVQVRAPDQHGPASSVSAAAMPLLQRKPESVSTSSRSPIVARSAHVLLITTRPGISRAARGIARTAADMTSREWRWPGRQGPDDSR